MPTHSSVPTISEEDEKVLAAAIFLNYVNSEFDGDAKLKHKQIIQQLTQIVANGPPQRIAAGPPQRVAPPSTSIDITAPETICTSSQIHQRQTRSNTPMPSIIEEVVDVAKVRFNLPPQGQVEKNSNEWWRNCIEKVGDRNAQMPNNYSLRQSNPQAIPDGRKQTGAKHASMKTIQRLIDDTQREKDTLTSRNTEAGSIPIKCQLDEELRRRQLAFKKTAQCKTHTAPGTSSTAPPPATPRRSPQNTLLQFSRPNTLMFVQADTFNEMLAHAMEAPTH